MREVVRSPATLGTLVQAIACVLLLLTPRMEAQAVQPGFINRLMPQPLSLNLGQGDFLLTPTFAATITGYRDARPDAAVSRALRRLRQKTGIAFTGGPQPAHGGGQLVVHVNGPGAIVQALGEDETYTLSVTPAQVRIDAATVVGLLRALETLLQLTQSSGAAFYLPAITIHDAPRFPWRGLMLDCGRHFEPVEVIKRTLDGMAAVKLNVFHWHLTEDQGFRIESRLYPALTAKGSDGLFYTQAEAAEIVAYARGLGIRVVPEFEMPGHATAWLVAYPELASGRAPTSIRREFGISDLALDPTREETYRFLDGFLGEMASLFPDQYVHIGGDETASPEWKSDPRILTFMRKHKLKDPGALQAYFNGRVQAILTHHGKHMVGWDEILNPAIPDDVIIQSWRGEAALIETAQAGHQGFLSAPFYLDSMKSAAEHYAADPLPATAPLTVAQRKLVLGGEICMFGEHIDALSVDSRLWPRSAAIAERFWSSESVIDIPDMYRRLDLVSLDLEALGITHLSHEDRALRQLAGTEQIDDLLAFASVLEPVSFHERYEQQKTSQLTALNRFVDAIRPDPPSRFAIGQLTHSFLQAPRLQTLRPSSPGQTALTSWFDSMRRSAPPALAQIDASPLLADVRPRALQLPGLATVGLQAIQLLSSGTPAPAGWKKSSSALIEEARKPAGIVRFTFLDALQSLVIAVGEK